MSLLSHSHSGKPSFGKFVLSALSLFSMLLEREREELSFLKFFAACLALILAGAEQYVSVKTKDPKEQTAGPE